MIEPTMTLEQSVSLLEGCDHFMSGLEQKALQVIKAHLAERDALLAQPGKAHTHSWERFYAGSGRIVWECRGADGCHERAGYAEKESSFPKPQPSKSQPDTMQESARPAAEQAVDDCETCAGIGTIDERLGGYSFSDAAAECPDCRGLGEMNTDAAPKGVI